MCGIAGFAGVTDAKKRYALVHELGLGTDSRGGHAAGFVTISSDGKTVRMGRTLGKWSKTRARFRVTAASQDGVTMLHARFSTCGNQNDPSCAHPFAVKREGSTVLWGAHNGALENARGSAMRNKRRYTVDSLECFELMADGAIEEVKKLSGWGVLSWVTSAERDAIRLCKMTDCGALYVVRTACGAIVYGSTDAIVHDALDAAEMFADGQYEIETGKVYLVKASGLFAAPDAPMTFSGSRWSASTGTLGAYGSYGKGWDRMWGDKEDDVTPGNLWDPKEDEDDNKEFQKWLKSHKGLSLKEATEDNEEDIEAEKYAAWLKENGFADDDDITEETDPYIRAEKAIAGLEVETDAWDDEKWWREAGTEAEFDRAAFLRQMTKNEREGRRYR